MKKLIFSLLLLLGAGAISFCQAQTDPTLKKIKVKIKFEVHFKRNCDSGLGLCIEPYIGFKTTGPITGFTTYEGQEYMIISREGLSDETIAQFENARSFPIDEDIYLTPDQLTSATYKGSVLVHRGNYPIRTEENFILIPVNIEYQ